ncbi:MAG: winged helix-turn-helix transcriptional regulator [Treponema sp.]|nr:winged helix-turn-helix transcriptional regulator [Treponema sp.]
MDKSFDCMHIPMMMEFSVLNRRFMETGFKPIARNYDLKLSDMSLLLLLYFNPKVNTAKDIAEYGELKRGNISVIVEDLSKRGLIVQVPNEDDRRVKTLVLTDACTGIIDDCKDVLERMLEITFKGISAEQLENCEKVFMKMYENMKANFNQENS